MPDPDIRNSDFESAFDDPTLIPAIHNFCDRRCDQCRLCDRCAVYRRRRSDGRRGPAEPTIEQGAQALIESLREAVQAMEELSERWGISATEEELEAAGRDEEERYQRVIGNPLVQAAKEYFVLAMPITRALRPLSLNRGDVDVMDAVETIEAIAHLVASKVYRAISGLEDEIHDPDDLQSDANGSAKIARLLIADSRRAWQVLMEAGRATADGVPAQLVRRLDWLDAGLAERFPRAMQFLRPGFDTEPDINELIRAEALAGAGDDRA